MSSGSIGFLLKPRDHDINNQLDPDVLQFSDTMEAFEFEQYVKSITHKSGNILDHVYREVASDLKISNVKIDELVSDHKWILFYVNFPVQQQISKE